MNKKAIAVVALLGIGAATFYTFHASNDQELSLTLYGNVDIREVNLAFRVAGRVADVMVDEGSFVRAGDALAVLDQEPLQHALRSNEANVAALTARNALMHQGYRQEDIQQAKAKLQAARVIQNETSLQLKRQKTLVPDGAVPKRALEAAQSAYDQAIAQVKIAEEQVQLMTDGYRKEEIAESDAQLELARANLDSAKLALSDTSLLAPSDGIILTRAIEKGSMVQAGAPVFSLSLTQPVWVRAYVGEPVLGHFSSGTKVSLHTDSRPDKAYSGVVGFVSPTAEFTPKSVETADLRTALVYRLRIVVNDPDSQLLQGMPVTIRPES